MVWRHMLTGAGLAWAASSVLNVYLICRVHGASDGGATGQELTALARELEALRQELQAERKKREAERAGRIRAEAQLRKRLVGDESPGPAGSEGSGAGADVAGGVQASHAGGSGVEMKVIGRMRSCFRRRFGAPRQGSVVAGSRGMLRMTAECNASVSTHSLDQYSHVWLIYVFHENTNLGSKAQVKSLVRPPRLCGDKVGLFATRTPHRPNPIGLSLVKLERIKDGVLYFSGIDLLDGTPILDVKPYLPPTDSVPPHLARAAAWFEELPGVDNATVTINQHAEQQLRDLVRELEFYDTYDDTWAAIREILRFDIRSLTMKQAVGRGGGGGGSVAGDSCCLPDRHASDGDRWRESLNFHFDNLLVYFSIMGESAVEVHDVTLKRVPLPGTAPRPVK